MKKAIIAGIICLAFVGINCGKGTRASVNAIVDLQDTGNLTVDPYFYLEIYKDNGFNYVPMIIVNSETLAIEENIISSFGSGETYNYSCITDWILPAGDFEMTVDYGEGRGQVKDSLPGFFDITAPQWGDVLELNEDLDISWGTSQCAGWYWLNVNVDYYYWDVDSYFQHHEYELDTIVYETELTISGDDLFPADIDYITSGDADVDISAYTGPDPKPLAKGNVTGDAVGFFWAHYDQGVSIGVGLQTAQGKTSVPSDPSARHRQILLDWAHQQ